MACPLSLHLFPIGEGPLTAVAGRRSTEGDKEKTRGEVTAGDFQEEDPDLKAKSLAAAVEKRDDLWSRLDQLVIDRLGRGQPREARKEKYLKIDLGIA